MISPEVAFQVSYLLQGVLDRGTAASARAQGVTDPLAGKTGTTNSARDSWFVGYSPDRATLVWVGYDDNRGTRLSGNRAAVPDLVELRAGAPAGRRLPADRSAGVRAVHRGRSRDRRLRRQAVPDDLAEAFLDSTEPETDCYLHAGGRKPRAQESEDEDWRVRRRPWWRRGVFKPRREESPDSGEGSRDGAPTEGAPPSEDKPDRPRRGQPR